MPYHKEEVELENDWKPRKTCPFCGSDNIHIGCQYQDCDECDDVEMSWCNDCGSSWGGAEYWEIKGLCPERSW